MIERRPARQQPSEEERLAAAGEDEVKDLNSRSAPPVSPTGSAERGAAATPDAAAASAGDIDDPYDMSNYSRRSMLDDDDMGAGVFTLPDHLKRAGWDYEFKTTEILGQPARISDRALEHRQGWRPVPAEDVAELLPPGFTGRYYEIDGQILMMRPKKLSVAAKNELYEKAERQKRDKLRSALASDPGGAAKHDPRMPRTAATITLEGEVGVHDQRFEPDQYQHQRRSAA